MIPLRWMIRYLLTFVFFYSVSNAKTTKVIYFGGVGATRAQMETWQNEATAKAALSSTEEMSFSFRGVPYPNTTLYDRKSVISAGKSEISSIIKEIRNNPDTNYILVGHSSGSALSNEIAEKMNDPKRISLVVLDGFLPSEKLQRYSTTSCFSARSTDSKLFSPNYKYMERCKHFTSIKTDICRNPTCLHFSVVNANPIIQNIRKGRYSKYSYNKIDPYLDWLPAERLGVPKPVQPDTTQQ